MREILKKLSGSVTNHNLRAFQIQNNFPYKTGQNFTKEKPRPDQQ